MVLESTSPLKQCPKCKEMIGLISPKSKFQIASLFLSNELNISCDLSINKLNCPFCGTDLLERENKIITKVQEKLTLMMKTFHD